MFGHIAQMPYDSDAKQILTAFLLENWRRPPGRPRTTWMKTTQQDLESTNEAIDWLCSMASVTPVLQLVPGCTASTTFGRY